MNARARVNKPRIIETFLAATVAKMAVAAAAPTLSPTEKHQR